MQLSHNNASVAQYGPPTPTPTVVIGTPTPHPHQETSLPYTGFNVIIILLIGAILIIGGLITLGEWYKRRD